MGELAPEVPLGLSALVDGCLAKSPALRPPDAAAVLAALDAVSRGKRPSLARPPPARRAPPWLWPVGLGVALGLGVTLFVLTRGGSVQSATPVPVALPSTPPAGAAAPLAPPDAASESVPLAPLIRPAASRAPVKPKSLKPARPPPGAAADDDVYGDRR